MVIGELMEQDKGKTLRPSVIEDHIPKKNIEVGLKIEQQKIRDYDSPEFIPSELEETRIIEPWRNGMIVKMLERRICYKYLENRLQEMWAMRGILNIVDLGQEYYFVMFMSKENQHTTLLEGMWFIYDHNLIVREWCPIFCPSNVAI